MVSNPPSGDDRVPFLSRAVNVSRSELPGLLSAAAYFFCLLCSYYILRPVRDEMGVRGGVENMQWLFTATFFAMLLAVPVFATLASRFRRTRLIPAVYGFFIACIALFWLWLRVDMQMVWAARSFFVWLSVFNLFVVSVFWSFLTDVFTNRQARACSVPSPPAGAPVRSPVLRSPACWLSNSSRQAYCPSPPLSSPAPCRACGCWNAGPAAVASMALRISHSAVRYSRG